MVGALGFEPRPADIFYVIGSQTGQRSSWSSAKQQSFCLHSRSNPVQLEPAILPGYTIPPLVNTRNPLGLSTQRLLCWKINVKKLHFCFSSCSFTPTQFLFTPLPSLITRFFPSTRTSLHGNEWPTYFPYMSLLTNKIDKFLTIWSKRAHGDSNPGCRLRRPA